MSNINSIIMFCTLALIAVGCCSAPTTIRETEKDVLVALPVKPINDSTMAAVVNDIIQGVKLSADGKDTVLKIIYQQVIPDSVKKDSPEYFELQKKFSRALSMISDLQGKFSVYAKNDSARGTMKEKGTVIEREKEFGLFDWIKFGSMFALAGVLIGVFLKR